MFEVFRNGYFASLKRKDKDGETCKLDKAMPSGNRTNIWVQKGQDV